MCVFTSIPYVLVVTGQKMITYRLVVIREVLYGGCLTVSNYDARNRSAFYGQLLYIDVFYRIICLANLLLERSVNQARRM